MPVTFYITDSIVKETIRVTSGVFMVRSIVKDTAFEMENGQTYNLRAGDRVAMYPPAIHKDPEIFENPLVSYSFYINYLLNKVKALDKFVVINFVCVRWFLMRLMLT